MAPTTTLFRTLTIQEGTLKFAAQSAVASNGLINIAVNNAGVFDLNGQNITVAGLSGNFAAVSGAATGTFTAGATAITAISSTANLFVGQGITGAGIPVGAYITGITSGTAVTISAPATAAGTATALSFITASTGNIVNSGGSSTLVVNAGINSVSYFGGAISGNLGLTKTGNGTLVLSAPINKDGAALANTYTGGTTINAGRVMSANAVAPLSTGTLAVRNTLALGTGPITLKGGILDLAATAGAGYAAAEHR